ncbi:transglycosylase domain-containing protein [Robertkochia flava]|uniref:transglycosylase domain-containing protein n=1 Tax=Robertkochia flava TaxID=3447986 RepID=UPI001CD00405|nr:transglycosylase domain-containing protein [Robertkochia marina]
MAIIIGSLFFLFTLFIISVFSGFWGPLPSGKDLEELQLDLATLITDHNGVPIGKIYQQDREPVRYEDLPEHLTEALIATEDARFYEHDGTDTRSLMRVFIKTILLQDASSGGGSTITQQLAKNLYGRKEMGFVGLVAHKIRESVIASRLEALYTKEEILEKYLNTVSFSDNTYGIESASRHFFSTPAKNLSIDQAAVLIGTLKATHTYNPRLFPEKSRERRNVVLAQMTKYGKLTEERYDSLTKLEIDLRLNTNRTSRGVAPYFREQVRKQLVQWARDYQKESGEELDIYADGLTIKTTLDLEMQVKAENALRTHMAPLQNAFEKSYGKQAPWITDKKLLASLYRNSAPYKDLANKGLGESAIMDSLDKKVTRQVFSWTGDEMKQLSIKDSLQHYLKLLNAGWVSVEASTGAVKTWIGGIDYRYFQYDHVAQSKRQVGSVFKPIVYATAIEQGIPACKYYELRKVEYQNLEGWTPDNASDKEDKNYMNYSMEYALSRSVNTVAVKVLEDAGINNVITTAKKMGIDTELPQVPSLALGTAEISVLEMAEAYTSFLNEGKSSEPYFITEILNKEGEVLYRREDRNTEREAAFSPRTASLVLQMLRSVVNDGTARRIRDQYGIQSDIAGKTGTTQNNKDGWFIGLSNDLVSVSWVGLDDQRVGFSNTAIGQGANAALPMFALWWKDLQKTPELKHVTNRTFASPEADILEDLDCDPTKKDGFFKRLFKNPNKTKRKNFEGLTEETK